MMTENQLKDCIRPWFSQNGFTVTDIPRDDCKKTPDFHLAKGQQEYLLEVKIKGDDPQEIKRDAEILAKGNILSRNVPLSRRNRLSTVVGEGHEQMEEYDPDHHCFHLLWIHCDGRDSGVLEERFRLTLFGQQRLFSLERSNLLHAFYFHESAFWWYRAGLDGVILSENKSDGLVGKLCVNTLTARKDQFRSSEFFRLHQEGLCDPDTIVQDGDAFIVDTADIDRNNETAVLDFLRSKYGLNHLQTIQLGAHSAEVRVPDASNREGDAC